MLEGSPAETMYIRAVVLFGIERETLPASQDLKSSRVLGGSDQVRSFGNPTYRRVSVFTNFFGCSFSLGFCRGCVLLCPWRTAGVGLLYPAEVTHWNLEGQCGCRQVVRLGMLRKLALDLRVVGAHISSVPLGSVVAEQWRSRAHRQWLDSTLRASPAR
ncbi:hypothetical protein CYLTODRAFT_130204 [Cylindrobasidium torrendii FP15055 ss-10]|uniref:Uncharacterized protein n=1 Tax=Cylindrobasidium torrendii FP15055 ss-10 TaxID=1314674 RepID=A0A0D7B272_9AGAR|nr:hypothetical protein CYLTODRAFT_130204 [Cylindrobasidium torrendii FP15055 ss-10]